MSLGKYLIGLGLCAQLVFASAARSQPPSLESLHDALRLSPAQESAWSAYQTSASAPSQAQARRRAAADLFASLPAPRRMDLMEAEMQQELRDLHQQALALKTFYATLTPDQQRTFDAQTLPSPSDR